jgi:F-type H+/Na+-transporting ATPase subunit alpha
MMEDFKHYLDKIGEVGFVEQIIHSMCYASGLPQAHPDEVVIFENGSLGRVMSFNKDRVEILILSDGVIKVGNRIVRTGKRIEVGIGKGLLGRVVDPLGKALDSNKDIVTEQYRSIDITSPMLMSREEVTKPLETGVGIVDTIVPIGKGQRELVIGDRKTGKTEFLLQTILSQARQGTVCIYAIIGQRQADVGKLAEFFRENQISNSTIIVATTSSDPAGLIFLTPYTAMTIAEFFRDNGLDVLLVLDDLTSHARYYREVSLLARRFPGRGSYPGDIFYVHSRLLERAGNFKKGSITCLPGAESVLGDLSGYIQTNIMAMTDGHIFFDIELYNKGRRPAVNPFLSVTRVGHQAQTNLQRELSRQISSFLVEHEKMQQFLHFGAEVGENVKKILERGEKLMMIFTQSARVVVPVNVNTIAIAGLWAGYWKDVKVAEMQKQIEKLNILYQTDQNYRKLIDQSISNMQSFTELVNAFRQNDDILRKAMG